MMPQILLRRDLQLYLIKTEHCFFIQHIGIGDRGVDEILGLNYLWNTGLHTSKITTTGFGDYWLEMQQNRCKQRDTLSVFAKPKPIVSLDKDTSICRFKPVILKTNISDYDSYLWSTGETTASILAGQSGTYYVTVTKDACEASDTVRVSTGGNCDIYSDGFYA